MAKRGRPKAFKSPEQLWNCFLKYKAKVKNDPIKKHDFVGKNANEVYRKLERPLTISGFECWLWDNDIIFDLKDYFANKKGDYSDFSPICTRIRQEIRDDQINGGMAGIYNPSITQRLNNLTEKTETKITMEQPLFGDEQEKNS